MYWLSRPVEADTETRTLLYRYGNFLYSGDVITDPLRGLEYLPGALQGLQQVQGQVPFLCAFADVGASSWEARCLSTWRVVADAIYKEVSEAEPRLAALAAAGEEWLEDEGVTVYFEIEARPGHTCAVRRCSSVLGSATTRNHAKEAVAAAFLRKKEDLASWCAADRLH